MPPSVVGSPRFIRSDESVRWTFGQRGAAAFFIVFLLLQIGIPLVKLLGPRPARLGWQMFSSYVVQPEVEVVYRDSTVAIDQTRYLAHLRSEMRTGDQLPKHLCRVLPRAQDVVVSNGVAKNERTSCH